MVDGSSRPRLNVGRAGTRMTLRFVRGITERDARHVARVLRGLAGVALVTRGNTFFNVTLADPMDNELRVRLQYRIEELFDLQHTYAAVEIDEVVSPHETPRGATYMYIAYQFLEVAAHELAPKLLDLYSRRYAEVEVCYTDDRMVVLRFAYGSQDRTQAISIEELNIRAVRGVCRTEYWPETSRLSDWIDSIRVTDD